MNFISADKFPDTQPRQRDIAAVVCSSPSERLRRLRSLELLSNSVSPNANRSVPAGGVPPRPSSVLASRRSAVALVVTALVSGVLVMSLAIAKSRSVESSPVAPATSYRAPERSEIQSLTESQRLALIQMSRTTRAIAIWGELRKRYDAPPFTPATFRELARLRFAEKPDGQRYHRLTVSGFRASDLACDILQDEHKIHVGYLAGSIKASTTVRCTCGWGCSVARGSNMPIKVARAMSTHLRTVEQMNDLRDALDANGNAAPKLQKASGERT